MPFVLSRKAKKFASIILQQKPSLDGSHPGRAIVGKKIAARQSALLSFYRNVFSIPICLLFQLVYTITMSDVKQETPSNRYSSLILILIIMSFGVSVVSLWLHSFRGETVYFLSEEEIAASKQHLYESF
jgi:hypothetical protein